MKNVLKLLIILILIPVAVTSQSLSGTVYESVENNGRAPLPGVNVYWENTTTGTTTDQLGQFDIQMPKGQHHMLVVSYIGYRSDTIHVHPGQGDIEVILTQNIELGEVEITGRVPGAHLSRTDPIVTQQVTVAELKKAACCNLSESFETNASVDVNYSDAITGAKQIKLLGLSGIYSQLQAENVPNLRGLATAFGLSYIPGSWMESIQVSKGTSSVKNGFESVSGQINVEYKKPANEEKLFLNLYINHMGRIEGNANSSVRLSDTWSTAVLAHASGQFIEADDNGDGFLDDPLGKQLNFMNRWRYDDEKGVHADFGVRYLLDEKLGGQVEFKKGMERNPGNPYGTGVTMNRFEAFSKTAFLFPSREVMNIAWINAYTYNDLRSFFGLRDYDATEQSFYTNLMFQSYILNTAHTFTTGFSYIYDDFDEMLEGIPLRRTEHIPGVFFEYTYIIPERFTVLAGIRADHHNLHGLFFTPRLHLKYNINEHTILRASAGKGYRSASVIAENLSMLTTSREIIIQDDLHLENAWNYGVNLTRYIDVAGRELIISGEYYRTDFVDQVIIDKEANNLQTLIYDLDGKSFANAFQLEAKYELVKQLEMTAAFRYNDVRMTIDETLMRAPLTDLYKGLLTMSYVTGLKRWQFDLTAQFNGTSRIPATDMNPEQYRMPGESPHYTILNAQVTKYFKRWDLYLGGENLTNYKQEEPIIASNDPYGPYFDASNIWGPVSGIKIYAGLRFLLK